MLLNYQEKQSALNEVDQECENIFIIHGLFGSLSNLASLASTLQQSHRVICVDLRNHGKSPHSTSISYQEMANDLFELANHLNIDNFSIVGHSMGGKVAMTCALQQPDRINKLVIADIAPITYPARHSEVFAALNSLLQHKIRTRKAADLLLAQQLKSPEVRQFLLKSLQKRGELYQLQFNLSALQHNYQSIRSWPAFKLCFNKETLFIKGENSDYITAENHANILQYFPNARTKVIKQTGHWLHSEKPKIFNRLVSQFFS